MADVNKAVIIPPVPRPPEDQTGWFGWFNQLVRWLDNFSRVFQAPFYLRGTGLFFLPGSLQDSGYGLRTGEVFSNNGVLTIVRDNDVWMPPSGVSATASVGTLTVTP